MGYEGHPLPKRSLRISVFMNDWTGEISEIERVAREVKLGSRIISISGLTSTAANQPLGCR